MRGRLLYAGLVGLAVLLTIGASDCGDPTDHDGDGLTNMGDECPYDFGIATNAGCPFALWRLLNTNATASRSDVVLQFQGTQWTPVTGDWDANRTETPGAYRSVSAVPVFRLRNANTTGNPNIEFEFGTGASGPLAVAGDWNDDGRDTIGIFRRMDGHWLLRNANSGGGPSLDFVYQPFTGGTPVVGDWNGDGIDTIGFFRCTTGEWFLRNSNSAGSTSLRFQYGPASPDQSNCAQPVVGDWDDDGDDTVGVRIPGLKTWKLRNSNSAGPADLSFKFGPSTGRAVSGDWDGDGTDTIGLISSAGR